MTDENTQSMSNDQLAGEIARVEGQISSTGQNPNPTPDKPTLFEKSREAELDAKLGKVHDRAEAKSEAIIGAKDVPSAKTDSFDAAFEKNYDFMNAPKAQREEMQSASKLVEEVRANAKKFGVELSDKDALFAAMQLEAQQTAAAATEHAPVVDHMRSAFKDSSPVESAKFFSDVKRAADQDLPGTVAWMAERYGMHPMQLAQAIAQRYGQMQQVQPQQYQQQGYDTQQIAALSNIIEQFGERNPRMEELEPEILALLRSEQFQRSNASPQRKLEVAYEFALKQTKGDDLDQKLERSIRAVANRKGAK
jgi:hypothetical protein